MAKESIPSIEVNALFPHRLASIAASAGHAARAILLTAGASALRQAIGIPLSAMAQADCDHMLAPARNLLGEEAAESIWSEGSRFNIEQIVAEAEKEYN